jgi:hypothetical protein
MKHVVSYSLNINLSILFVWYRCTRNKYIQIEHSALKYKEDQ